jgi:hypothetical protein
MIRQKGTRDASSGFLIPLKKKQPNKESNGGTLKQPELPFQLDDQDWICDFRSATPASLAILDLSTLRKDGKVRFDAGMTLPEGLLPGQQLHGSKLLEVLNAAIASRRALAAPHTEGWFDPRCQLTLSGEDHFKTLVMGAYHPVQPATRKKPETPDYFTWHIRRTGRVRMPYAASVLNNYLSVMSREAFDLDYLKADSAPCGTACATSVPEPATDADYLGLNPA